MAGSPNSLNAPGEGSMVSIGDLAQLSQMAPHEVIAQALREALPYVEALRGHFIVIKLGGSTLESQRDALEDIVWLRSLGAQPVLAHGGGPEINAWLDRLSIPHRFERGLRVTDAETLEVVRMALAGKVNGELVQMLARLGGRAVGLTGLDGALLRARPISDRLGYVGQVVEVNPDPIETLSDAGYIPVVAPLAIGPDGEALNVNADDAAADLARGLRATKLLYISDVPGVMDANGELISVLTDEDARRLIGQGAIKGGMIPKVEACLRALDVIERAHIVDGGEPHVLVRELFTHRGAGTMIERAR
ncbi:MAG TPA: acetylglutamate kinase [Ktedonobacterales bacterium]|nr:acetylglutamate kinase [Ktedonobacterales bacterium]